MSEKKERKRKRIKKRIEETLDEEERNAEVRERPVDDTTAQLPIVQEYE